ncbi:MAG: hypothetical protein J6A37_11395 [Oscillospiraceae bacterium]|nr:hypothetical protein [Oscillospiraceae bacterium]
MKKTRLNSGDVLNMVMTIIYVSIGIIAGLIFISINKSFGSEIKTKLELDDLRDEITAGEIVDKYTKDGYTTSSGGNGFAYNPSNGGVNYVVGVGGNKTYVPIRYYITIKCEYEYKGELIEDTKDFQVERDVYLAYKIGDYFDIQDFRYVSEETIIT